MLSSISIAEKAGPFMYPQGELESLNLALVKGWLSNILLFEETLMHQPCLHDSKRCPGTHESWVARWCPRQNLTSLGIWHCWTMCINVDP